MAVSVRKVTADDKQACLQLLGKLVVDPDTRGKNVGALLVEATLEQARQRGCAEYGLYLIESTEKNWPFYQKFGFQKVGSELRQRLH